jgi:hypothetical protein
VHGCSSPKEVLSVSVPWRVYHFFEDATIAPTVLKESEDPNRPSREYSMFVDLRKKYHWVLPTYRYTDLEHILTSFQEMVIEPAEQKAQELEKR